MELNQCQEKYKSIHYIFVWRIGPRSWRQTLIKHNKIKLFFQRHLFIWKIKRGHFIECTCPPPTHTHPSGLQVTRIESSGNLKNSKKSKEILLFFYRNADEQEPNEIMRFVWIIMYFKFDQRNHWLLLAHSAMTLVPFLGFRWVCEGKQKNNAARSMWYLSHDFYLNLRWFWYSTRCAGSNSETVVHRSSRHYSRLDGSKIIRQFLERFECHMWWSWMHTSCRNYFENSEASMYHIYIQR